MNAMPTTLHICLGDYPHTLPLKRGEIASPTVSDRKLPHEVRRLNARKVSDRAFWALFEQADGTLLGGFDTLHESGDPNGDTVEFRTLGLRDNTRLRIRDFLLDPDGSLWVTSDYALIRRLWCRTLAVASDRN